MASKDTNSTIFTVAFVAVGAWVAWKLFANYRGGGGSSSGGYVGGTPTEAPYYPQDYSGSDQNGLLSIIGGLLSSLTRGGGGGSRLGGGAGGGNNPYGQAGGGYGYGANAESNLTLADNLSADQLGFFGFDSTQFGQPMFDSLSTASPGFDQTFSIDNVGGDQSAADAFVSSLATPIPGYSSDGGSPIDSGALSIPIGQDNIDQGSSGDYYNNYDTFGDTGGDGGDGGGD